MPWKIIEGPKVVKLTSRLAKHFAEMEPAPGDRDSKDWRRKLHRESIKDGRFRAPEWASALCEETGKEYRVNGKHTAMELAEMNGDLPSLNVFLTKFGCETLRDVSDLYSTFDTRTSSRTSGDINKSFQMSHPVLANIPLRYVSAAVSGIAYATWGLQYHPQDERSQLMFPNVDFVTFVSEVCSVGKAGSLLRKTGVVAAMFRTFNKSHSDSRKFWEAVRDATGHPFDVPDRLLNRYLLTTTAGGGRSPIKGHKTASMEEFFVKSIKWWNMWRKNEKGNVRYTPGEKIPTAY